MSGRKSRICLVISLEESDMSLAKILDFHRDYTVLLLGCFDSTEHGSCSTEKVISL